MSNFKGTATTLYWTRLQLVTYSGRWWQWWACYRWTSSCSRSWRAVGLPSCRGPCPSWICGTDQFWRLFSPLATSIKPLESEASVSSVLSVQVILLVSRQRILSEDNLSREKTSSQWGLNTCHLPQDRVITITPHSLK